MNKSQLNPAPDLTIPAIPVICDECRETGMAGDGRFAGVPDILDFEPVPRRARADGWKPEHQRAFIAALAITGSPRQAARAIGKHEFGAQQLRSARGGRSFAEAWDAAEDIHREREHMRIHASFERARGKGRQLRRAARGRGTPTIASATTDRVPMTSTRSPSACEKKMEILHRVYLREISADPEKRHAYEVLNGPVDWGGIDKWSLRKADLVPTA